MDSICKKNNWYKSAQKKWKDFQWEGCNFKYKQCYDCGRFFLPNKMYSYPPGINLSEGLNSNIVLDAIPKEDREKYVVNKNSISHGLCPKCFIENMQNEFGLTKEEAANELVSVDPNGWEDLYLN